MSLILDALPERELSSRLRGDGLRLRIPPFVACITSEIPIVAEGISVLYGDYEVLPNLGFSDFHVAVNYSRRFPKATCVFVADGMRPFTPLAAGEGFAFLEWGLNWAVTSYCHTFLTIHSAVLEKNGKALILPAPPGSGKSTLCAALISRGWRLLSDEMALLDMDNGHIVPFPRPVSLKNNSIEIIRKFSPGSIFGPVAKDTLKGTVAHLKVSARHLAQAGDLAVPAWVVFPKYRAEASSKLTERGKGASLIELAGNSFNRGILGRRGFEALSELISRSDCYDFEYSDLEEAIAVFQDLSSQP